MYIKCINKHLFPALLKFYLNQDIKSVLELYKQKL
jgi:hypothetical protein